MHWLASRRKFNGQADAANQVLEVRVGAQLIPARGDPHEHRALILKRRNEILTDLVNLLPTYVKEWRAQKETPRTTFRMSSFELLVRRFIGQARAAALFNKLSDAQEKIETENNSLIVTLDHYFRTHTEDAVRLNAKDFMLHLQTATGEEKWTTKGLVRAIKKQQSTLVKRYGMREDGWKSGASLHVQATVGYFRG